MISATGITSTPNFYESAVKKQEKSDDVKKTDTQKAKGAKGASTESKLSSKAQKYLDNLRKQYGDYDFSVADSGEEKQALSKQTDKEFSVVFSSEEIERMASDENYAKNKINAMETAVRMSQKISDMLSAQDENGNAKDGSVSLKNFSVSISDNGATKYFAELEKSDELQKERLEKAKEKRAEEKKAKEKKESNDVKADDKADKTNESASKEPYQVKSVTIEAKTEDELLDKIKNINWDNIKAQTVEPGGQFDFEL